MVKLIVDDYEQMTVLEQCLINQKIEYEIELTDAFRSLKTPYLIIDGVPLDFDRSIKWLRGKHKHG